MNRLAPLVQNFKQIINKYPITRGMITYAISWPASSLIQQTIEKKKLGNYDWLRVFRFGVFGTIYVAPCFYCWIKLASAMYPANNIKSAITKASIETISYTPLAIGGFYLIMTMLEGKGFEAAIAEVRNKFLPTFKVAAVLWSVLGTFNFAFVPQKNRVVFISICSFMWSIFLCYMKHLDDIKNAPKFLNNYF